MEMKLIIHFSAYDFYEHESNAGKLQRQFQQIHIMHETLRHTITVERFKKKGREFIMFFSRGNYEKAENSYPVLLVKNK